MAAEKMLTTDKDISEIAYDCGFSSPGYFSKLFKEVFGNTPRLYRQEITKNGDTYEKVDSTFGGFGLCVGDGRL